MDIEQAIHVAELGLIHYRGHLTAYKDRDKLAPPHFSMNDWTKIVNDWATEKGWNEQPISIEQAIVLMHTELSEAYEEFRHHDADHVYFENDSQAVPKPEGVSVEIADVLIRIFHYAAVFGWNLDALVNLKMAYNRTRPYRHGNKKS